MKIITSSAHITSLEDVAIKRSTTSCKKSESSVKQMIAKLEAGGKDTKVCGSFLESPLDWLTCYVTRMCRA